jgi:starvation-inducible DNA-binding protein
VQLGGVAEGTARAVAKRSALAEYPAKAVDGRSHVEAVDEALRGKDQKRAAAAASAWLRPNCSRPKGRR